MARFNINERVIFTYNGVRHRGKVTRVEPKKRRVVTDSGRRLVVPVRSLKRSPDRVLILETPLDRSLKSGRIYGPMMQQWLSALGVEALYERVHTVQDMRQFLQRDGRNASTRFIHIMGHGTDGPGINGATLHLTFEPLNLREEAQIFQGLNGKIIIFSCCEIGANLRVLEDIKQASGAAGVIAYRIQVDDWYTNVAEGLLYERLVNTTCSPQAAVRLVSEAMRCLGTKVAGIITRKPVLVCV